MSLREWWIGMAALFGMTAPRVGFAVLSGVFVVDLVIAMQREAEKRKGGRR